MKFVNVYQIFQGMHFSVTVMHDPRAVNSVTWLKELLICIFAWESGVCPWCSIAFVRSYFVVVP